MEILLLDLRHTARRLLRSPQHTLLIVLCLTLGIGANTAIFSVVNNLLLRPLPIAEIDRVGATLDMREDVDPYQAATVSYLAFLESGDVFESFGAAEPATFNVTGDQPERLRAARISHGYLKTLGIEPVLGRGITAEDDRPGGPDVALVSHALWQRRLGGSQDVVGSELLLEGRRYTVIGVLPSGFDLPGRTDLWVPLQLDTAALTPQDLMAHRFFLLSRIRDGVSFAQAREEVAAMGRSIAERYPDDRGAWGLRLVPLRYQLLNDLEGDIPRTLYMILGVVAFLLLIACANVASLLLVRAMERQHEFALESALGAGRGRLFRQVVLESLTLSLVSGALGMIVAYLALPTLMRLSPVDFQSFRNSFTSAHLDWRVLGFTFGVALVTGLLFALLPALRIATSGRLAPMLIAGARRTTASRQARWVLGALVVTEVAVAVALLLGAGLMVRSFQRHQAIDLGYETENRLLMELALAQDRYGDHVRRSAFVEQVVERVRALPGVEAAGISADLPLGYGTWDAMYIVEGRPNLDRSKVPITAHRMVSPGYLETLGVRLVEGRLLDERDREGSQPVVVVSRDLAEEAWPGENALGKRLRRTRRAGDQLPWMSVVGVVEEVREDRFNFRIERPAWYVPYSQHENTDELWLMVETDGDPLRQADAVRRAVWSVDPDQPISNVTTLDTHLEEFFTPQRFSAVLTGLFAVLGLVLAAVGLYGVMSYAVTQRTREFGVRIALGASPSRLLRGVLGRGLTLALVGLAVGLVASLILSRFFSSLLFGVSASDPLLLGTIAAVLLAVAFVANLLPALRSVGTSPVEALRQE